MLRLLLLILFLLNGATPAQLLGFHAERIAGTGALGFEGDGGPATEATFNQTFGVVRGPDGALYVCDTGNHVVRCIDQNGTITTVAGNGKAGYDGDGGPATKALCFEPYEIRFDEAGDLYFVEMKNHIVRRVDMDSGLIETVAGTGQAGFSGDGGSATEAQLNRPHSIQFGADGRLYICDIGNHRIRVVDLESGQIETFSGTGKKNTSRDGSSIKGASLNGPRALDRDANGDLWLALREGNAVLRLDMKQGTLHYVAGTGKKGFSGNGGPALEATLSGPKGIAVGPNGNIYLADTESHSVRMIDRASGTLELIAGDGSKGFGPAGPALACQMDRLHGIYVDPDGTVFVGDSNNHCVWAFRPLRD